MPCREYVRGSCPYRDAYDCDGSIREIGLQIGHCAVEQVRRDDAWNKARGLLAHLIWSRAEAEQSLELYLDAWIYLNRAAVWAGIVWNREPAMGGLSVSDAEYLRADTRYRKAGSDRLLKRARQLRPFLQEAVENRRDGSIELLRELARPEA